MEEVQMSLQNVTSPNDHAQARVLLNEAWKAIHGIYPTKNQLDAAQAIASLETVYGRAGQFAQWAMEGKFNWGALQRARNADGTCPPGMQPGQDALNPAAINPRCFFIYPSDFEAAKAYLRVLTVNFPVRAAAVVKAMATGDLIQVAQAMRNSDPAHAFFELDANEYGRRLAARAVSIFGPNYHAASAIVQQAPVKSSAALLGILALGGGIWYFLSRPKSSR